MGDLGGGTRAERLTVTAGTDAGHESGAFAVSQWLGAPG
jgi:hypothetical protein